MNQCVQAFDVIKQYEKSFAQPYLRLSPRSRMFSFPFPPKLISLLIANGEIPELQLCLTLFLRYTELDMQGITKEIITISNFQVFI